MGGAVLESDLQDQLEPGMGMEMHSRVKVRSVTRLTRIFLCRGQR